jgi:hypothetical protein
LCLLNKDNKFQGTKNRNKEAKYCLEKEDKSIEELKRNEIETGNKKPEEK